MSLDFPVALRPATIFYHTSLHIRNRPNFVVSLFPHHPPASIYCASCSIFHTHAESGTYGQENSFIRILRCVVVRIKKSVCLCNLSFIAGLHVNTFREIVFYITPQRPVMMYPQLPKTFLLWFVVSCILNTVHGAQCNADKYVLSKHN